MHSSDGKSSPIPKGIPLYSSASAASPTEFVLPDTPLRTRQLELEMEIMNIQSQNRTNLTRGSDFDESLARSHEYLLKDMRAEADFIQKKLLQSQPQTPPNETLFSSSSSNVPHSIDRSKLPNLPPALLNIFKISWSPSMQKDMDQAFTTYWQRFQSFCTTMHTDVLDQDAYFIRWLKLILHPRDQSIVDEHIYCPQNQMG